MGGTPTAQAMITEMEEMMVGDSTDDITVPNPGHTTCLDYIYDNAVATDHPTPAPSRT